MEDGFTNKKYKPLQKSALQGRVNEQNNLVCLSFPIQVNVLKLSKKYLRGNKE